MKHSAQSAILMIGGLHARNARSSSLPRSAPSRNTRDNRYRRLYIHVVAIHAGARQRGGHKIFIALNGGLSILFALATLYAWIESNAFVADFFHYLFGNHAHHARHYVHLPQEFPQAQPQLPLATYRPRKESAQEIENLLNATSI